MLKIHDILLHEDSLRIGACLKEMLMRLIPVLLLAGVVQSAWGDAPSTTSVQSSESYEAAIRNISSSPSYVLIFVGDEVGGQTHSICTTANFLLGAIHREYGIGYERTDLSKAVDIAIKTPDRTFRFHQPALNNIRLKYSLNDLEKARAFLAAFSTSELTEKFSSLYGEKRLPTNEYSRDAIACVLIERGLSPKMADISGQVYVDR